MMTKGRGGQKSLKIDDVFYEWPLIGNDFISLLEILFYYSPENI